MMRAFISSALFCVLVLAFMPVSPVKSSFDGRLSFKELFYTYNGQQSPTVNPNGEDPIFDDEDDDGNSDYVPNLDSGYVPGSDKKMKIQQRRLPITALKLLRQSPQKNLRETALTTLRKKPRK